MEKERHAYELESHDLVIMTLGTTRLFTLSEKMFPQPINITGMPFIKTDKNTRVETKDKGIVITKYVTAGYVAREIARYLKGLKSDDVPKNMSIDGLKAFYAKILDTTREFSQRKEKSKYDQITIKSEYGPTKQN